MKKSFFFPLPVQFWSINVYYLYGLHITLKIYFKIIKLNTNQKKGKGNGLQTGLCDVISVVHIPQDYIKLYWFLTLINLWIKKDTILLVLSIVIIIRLFYSQRDKC